MKLQFLFGRLIVLSRNGLLGHQLAGAGKDLLRQSKLGLGGVLSAPGGVYLLGTRAVGK